MGQEGGLHKGLKAQWGGPGALLVGEGVVRKWVACMEHQQLNQEVEVCAGQGARGEHTAGSWQLCCSVALGLWAPVPLPGLPEPQLHSHIDSLPMIVGPLY